MNYICVDDTFTIAEFIMIIKLNFSSNWLQARHRATLTKLNACSISSGSSITIAFNEYNYDFIEKITKGTNTIIVDEIDIKQDKITDWDIEQLMRANYTPDEWDKRNYPAFNE